MLPTTAGVGLKPEHYKTILEEKPDIGWFEFHPENYMGNGGAPHFYLEQIRHNYSLSMHGVGLSLGSIDKPDVNHLKNLKNLLDRYQPELFSEHLAWSRNLNSFYNDLLPVPYTEEHLKYVVDNINRTQEALNRKIIIENPSIYVGISINTMSEVEFLSELVTQTKCGLLLDVNNVYVSSNNTGTNPYHYIDNFPLGAVEEIHLAGHQQQILESENKLKRQQTILIDDHGSEVCDDVWHLYAYTLQRAQRRLPTLIEWDTTIPAWPVLFAEANIADRYLNAVSLNQQESVLC